MSTLAHAAHPIAASLSAASVELLLHRVALPPGARMLDLGCGEAAWSLRALDRHPDARADGVDISATGLDHADHPDAAAAVAAARQHRSGWLRGYRGVLGFVTLALRPVQVALAAHGDGR